MCLIMCVSMTIYCMYCGLAVGGCIYGLGGYNTNKCNILNKPVQQL